MEGADTALNPPDADSSQVALNLCRCSIRSDDDNDDHDGRDIAEAKPINSLKQAKGISKSKQKKLEREEQVKQRKSMVFQAFQTFYGKSYGERWPSLLEALKNKPRSACLQNRYADPRAFSENIAGVSGLSRVPFVSLPLYECTDLFPHPERDDRNIYTCYMLDSASVLVTEALDIAAEDNVLDLCAAPGGKSLAILQHLQLGIGSLVANEISADRRKRLWKVITDYIPENLRSYVSITGRDGTTWSQSQLFDKVLVDAPCSSERHLLQDPDELCKWTDRRTLNCAKRQVSLLTAGLRSARLGGLVVYSTCSISYIENDNVIEKALKKVKLGIEVLHKPQPIGEKTKYGWILLPDVTDGWGPIYFSILKRIDTGSGATECGIR